MDRAPEIPSLEELEKTMAAVWQPLLKEDTVHELSGMSIRAKKDEILSKLRTNREKHSVIVAEARKGYVDKARASLRERLDQLESGKIVSLTFSLDPPQDHSSVYDTAIQMLELATDDVIELDSVQVRNLVMDQWDWSTRFLAVNAAYSETAAARLR